MMIVQCHVYHCGNPDNTITSCRYSYVLYGSQSVDGNLFMTSMTLLVFLKQRTVLKVITIALLTRVVEGEHGTPNIIHNHLSSTM